MIQRKTQNKAQKRLEKRAQRTNAKKPTIVDTTMRILSVVLSYIFGVD